MKNTTIFLNSFRNDVFKLLPMREATEDGKENHIADYIPNLIITAEGAVITFKELETMKPYIYVLNNLNYMSKHLSLDLNDWRKIILNSTSILTNLIKKLNGGEDYGRKEK